MHNLYYAIDVHVMHEISYKLIIICALERKCAFIMLYLIGIGLSDEKDITIKGFEVDESNRFRGKS